jgi:hypothetical protein
VPAAFDFEPNLSLAEDHLRVVWSFHAAAETSGPWVAEIWETIGSVNGVYYYIDRHDEDGVRIKIGRMDEAAAIEHGLARSGRTDEQRKAPTRIR